MTKQFIASVIISVLVLIIFSYFIFGLNGSAKTTPPTPSPSIAANTEDKLQIQDEKIGTGEAVKKGDTVEINYIGTLANGTKFDASADHGSTFETQIGVGQVIKGWDEGIIGMKVGGKRKLTIPPSLGYGSQAVGS